MKPQLALDAFTKLLQATADAKVYEEHAPVVGFVAQFVPLK